MSGSLVPLILSFVLLEHLVLFFIYIQFYCFLPIKKKKKNFMFYAKCYVLHACMTRNIKLIFHFLRPTIKYNLFLHQKCNKSDTNYLELWGLDISHLGKL